MDCVVATYGVVSVLAAECRVRGSTLCRVCDVMTVCYMPNVCAEISLEKPVPCDVPCYWCRSALASYRTERIGFVGYCMLAVTALLDGSGVPVGSRELRWVLDGEICCIPIAAIRLLAFVTVYAYDCTLSSSVLIDRVVRSDGVFADLAFVLFEGLHGAWVFGCRWRLLTF